MENKPLYQRRWFMWLGMFLFVANFGCFVAGIYQGNWGYILINGAIMACLGKTIFRNSEYL